MRCPSMSAACFGALLFLILTVAGPLAPSSGAEPPDPDIVKIRTLYEARGFKDLNTLLETYQAECEKDVLLEFRVRDAFAVFTLPIPGTNDLLDEWVRSSPDSWVPLLARAKRYEWLGWKARGGKWINETGDEKIENMKEYFLMAARDAEAALRIHPRLGLAYVLLMSINQNVGGQANGEMLLEKALEISPDSYFLRSMHMLLLTPRWGGSYEAMERFALEADRHSGKNPLLKTLRGAVLADRANLAGLDKKHGVAVELFQKALEFGENRSFLYSLANECYRDKKYELALTNVDRAIALRPVLADGYALRSKILFTKGNRDGALQDLETIERIWGPHSEEAKETRKWESQEMVKKGDAIFRRDLPKAIERYSDAVRFLPGNAHAYCWRGIAYHRLGNTESALADLKKALELNPRLYQASKGLSDLLAGLNRDGEVIAVWSRLIELEPGNAKAYNARSEVHSKMGDAAAALGDAKKACELGVPEGCKRVETLREKR